MKFSLSPRLTLVYAIVVWFHVTLAKFGEIGTAEIAISSHRGWCANSWYTNLLYANNFWHTHEQV